MNVKFLYFKNILKILSVGLTLIFCSVSKAQTIYIEPLFEYPVAPEELITTTDKCNYLVTHFWDNFNFKQNKAVDQNALNDAFNVYTTALSMADVKIADKEINKLLDNISKNPVLQVQFTKAAEENLYGPRADIWIDDVYIKFLEAFNKNKKIPDNRKSRYKNQYKVIQNSKKNNKMPEFTFESIEGRTEKYFPMTTPTLLIFGNPEDIDWRMNRLRLETNGDLNTALSKGKINILYIIDSDIENWKDLTDNYSSYWKVGMNKDIKEIVDIRMNPTIYYVGPEGLITGKNLTIEQAVNYLLNKNGNQE